ncbi:SusC/RagA family TonB-linked outer membrane protein [Chitinophaga nivalis]|uniref:SusC/RagA family TonB-linked outer membrane protein n=1 Tax=Chitinophaga nivalis TaxID=2991709 RepID=A0ABT3IP16_9BACT|nr:SusC/RagA family TonB-linked outer membrane protein [Chitinophaga nivalis]MCW3464610.1 SusC/RagA family TonB-linked outer membrane protein [Chitinophaga nivalis]MCW3485699.1 SusC/RagA family TonB-linked outer membrane protein [Chitinophaga nivalis]
MKMMFSCRRHCLQVLSAGILLLHFTVDASAITQTEPANSFNNVQAKSGKTFRHTLEEIATQYKVRLVYETSMADARPYVKPPQHKPRIEEVLSSILSASNLRFIKVDDSQFAIIAQPAAKNQPDDIIAPNNAPAAALPLQKAGGNQPSPLSADTVIDRRLIRGTITEEDGSPIPGATITLPGTSIGATSNASGAFTLMLPGTHTAPLLITSVGYLSQKMAVKGVEVLTVKLKRNVSQIQQVEVNAGVYKRPTSSYTGAATTITAEQLKQVSNKNVLEALKALDPSFKMPDNLQFGSDPNRLPDIQVRGAASLPNMKGDYTSSPNLPLFILDGFEASLQRVFDLDMNRIAAVTLLKDAAATAIYGSRGANGVLVIETVRPEKGRLRLSYTNDFKVAAPDLNVYNLLNAEEKLQLEKDAGLYTYITSGPGFSIPYPKPEESQRLKELYAARQIEVRRGVNTYWLSQPVRTGVYDRHSLYAEGGDDYVRYGLQLAAGNEQGVMKGSGRSNYSGEVSLAYQYKQLRFRNALTVNYNKSTNSPFGSFSQFGLLNPYYSIYDDEGRMKRKLDEGLDNPLYNGTMFVKDESTYTEFINNFSAEWQISQPFRVIGSFSLMKQDNGSEQFLPAEHTAFSGYSAEEKTRRGSYTIQHGKRTNYETSLTLNYGRAVNGSSLYASGGFNLAGSRDDNNGYKVEGFPNDRMDASWFAKQYEKNGHPTGSESITRRVGVLANVNYAYYQKYLIDLSYRIDGSSQFGANKRFGEFWSAGIGWNMHKESFLQGSKIINLLKLRASYGARGSLNVPAYQALATYNYYNDVYYYDMLGAYMMSLGNKELSWQNRLTANIGADMSLFNSRLNIEVNYYRDVTKNAIADISTPPSIGFEMNKTNFGELKGKGLEVYLRYMIIRDNKKNLYWNINASVVRNRTIVSNIADRFRKFNSDQNTKPQTGPVTLLVDGYPLNTIWAVPSLGIDPGTGSEIFRRADGTVTTAWSATDKQAVGNMDPQYEGTFGTFVGYKGFNLNALMRYRYGGQIFNATLLDRVENADVSKNVDRRVYEQRWRRPGDVTFFKNVASRETTKPSSRFVQNENTLSLESISLSYDFNRRQISFLRMQNLRLSLYMNEVFRLSTVEQERGLDYPFARSFSFSLKTQF